LRDEPKPASELGKLQAYPATSSVPLPADCIPAGEKGPAKPAGLGAWPVCGARKKAEFLATSTVGGRLIQ